MSQIVTFTSDELDVSVATLLGVAVPTLTEGGGGVARISRDRRKPLTDYDELPLIVQTFEVILDGYPSQSVDGEVAALERLHGIGRTEGPLPTIKLAGPVRYPSLEWLLDGLELMSDENMVIRDGEGRFLRAAFSVTLVEYVDPSALTIKPGKRAKGKKKAKIKRYRVKSGDNLRKIAARFLKSSDRWKEIAKANPKLKLRKPSDVRTGQLLRLP